MNEILLVLSIVAILFSIVGLIVGCVSLAMVIGLSRSTHTVQFKEITPPTIQDDPFSPLEVNMEEEVADEAEKVLSLMKSKKKKPNHPVVNEEEITPEEPSAW